MEQSFGDQVRDRRLAMELSQGQLGKVVGVSRSTVRNIEGGRPMEDRSRRAIERALGWIPETTEPFVEAGTMAALVGGLLVRDEGGDSFGLERARNVFHAFMKGVTAGTVSPELVDDLVKEVTNHIPRSKADPALAALGRATDVMLGTSAGSVRISAGSGSVTVTDSAGLTDSASVVLNPATPDREPVIVKAGLIHITPSMSLLAAMIPLPADVTAELTDDDITWVIEALTKQGRELASTIARTKQRERSQRERRDEQE